MTPKVTVALPLWESGDIAWLCLESLCRQKVGVEWELIVAEEQTENMLGEEGLFSFRPRLRKAGCANIVYIPVKEKMYLANKWNMIARYASVSSEVFQLVAADDYFQPMLLHDAWSAIGINGYDWCQSYQCHFYDIDTGKLVEYRRLKSPGVQISMDISLARKIPTSTKVKGIDGHIFNSVKPKKIYSNTFDHSLKTVCTQGRNKISLTQRAALINKTRAPMRRCSHTLDGVLPFDIYTKLLCM